MRFYLEVEIIPLEEDGQARYVSMSFLPCASRILFCFSEVNVIRFYWFDFARLLLDRGLSVVVESHNDAIEM